MTLIEDIKNHKKICQDLLYADHKVIENITKVLQLKFEENFGNTLNDKNSIFKINQKRKSYPAKTSGTTSGKPFHYLIDAEFYNFVEFECHYKPIVTQFKINCKNILFLLKTNLKAFNTNQKTLINHNRHPSISSHGTTGTFTHYLQWESDIHNTIKKTIEYLSKNKIDIILTDGSIISLLTDYIQKNNIKTKLCSLLSNTNEKLLRQDAIFLKNNGNIDNWSDHMRCWDGGASFTTCQFYNYHILENLSFVQEINKKLISTDYFNIVQPFVNYWNGDYCEINQEYQLCQCGKWYREFMILPRVFSVNGITSEEIKNKIKALKITGIKQVRCENNQIELVGNLNEANQKLITEILPNFNLNFSTH